MRLGELSPEALRASLREGLGLVTGPFVFRIRSRLPGVAANLARLYPDFPLAEGPFADFHVDVDRVRGVRRYFKPQAQFWMDGYTPFKPLPADQAFAMLEWGMNWCVTSHAHDRLMLHAAVLERDGCALIMPGDPGAGKSTLTAALMLAGWRLLSDEIALIDTADGLLRGLARPVSLKNASIDIIRRHDAAAVLGEVAKDTHKGTVAHLQPTRESVARVDEPARPRWIVFPRWQADVPVSLTPHAKSAAFLHLASHAFNYSILGAAGFQQVSALMEACDCWDFRYSRLPDAIRTCAELPP
jgi:HprK-related kinase A